MYESILVAASVVILTASAFNLVVQAFTRSGSRRFDEVLRSASAAADVGVTLFAIVVGAATVAVMEDKGDIWIPALAGFGAGFLPWLGAAIAGAVTRQNAVTSGTFTLDDVRYRIDLKGVPSEFHLLVLDRIREASPVEDGPSEG